MATEVGRRGRGGRGRRGGRAGAPLSRAMKSGSDHSQRGGRRGGRGGRGRGGRDSGRGRMRGQRDFDKKKITKEDLDKELEQFLMKDEEGHARVQELKRDELDNELDKYMSLAREEEGTAAAPNGTAE